MSDNASTDNASRGGIREPLRWIRESGILVVTVTGLALYFFLSIPATLFYSQLGTTPGEVGINYVNLLSSSTFELLVIFVLLATVVFFGGLILAYFLMAVNMFRPSWDSFRNRERNLTRQEGMTVAFNSNLKLYRKMPEYFRTRGIFWSGFPKSFTELEAAMERRLELLKISDPTTEQSTELARIERQLTFPKKARMRKELIRTLVTLLFIIRRRIRQLIVSFGLVIVIIILPALAFLQAAQVRDGHTYFASNTGIFDYSADPVSVYPIASSAAITAILNSKDKELFLLGENTVYAVFYSPLSRATIRVPITTVIISSVRS